MHKLKMNTAIQPDQQLTSLVMDAIAITKRLFNEAKKPGFTQADWAPLAALVAVNEFRWVSPTYEELTWQEYTSYLTEWAGSVDWQTTIRRIHQWQNTVFLEHEERSTFGDTVEVSGSVAIYDFNEAGKIRRLAIYLQHKPTLGL